MLDFIHASPTTFVFGHDAERKIGEQARKLCVRKALVHYGGGSAVRSGLVGRVCDSLNAAGIASVVLGGAQPNPVDTLVYEGVALCRREGVDFVVGVGGGSAIDSAKAIAVGAANEGDFYDFWAGKRTLSRALPIAAVVTMAAAGSESSNSCVITNTRVNFKGGLRSELLRPKIAVMNPELTFTLPPYQKACGAADIMAHVFERYFTRTQDVSLTDRLCEALLSTVLEAAPRAIANAADYAAHADLLWAGTLAHNDSVGVGRQQDWGSHAISHELSAAYGVAHGAALSVIFPAWMRHQLDADVKRFARLARTVLGVDPAGKTPRESALAGIEALHDFYVSLGLPRGMRALGVPREDVPSIAARIPLKNNGRLGFFRPLDAAGIEAVLYAAYED